MLMGKIRLLMIFFVGPLIKNPNNCEKEKTMTKKIEGWNTKNRETLEKTIK